MVSGRNYAAKWMLGILGVVCLISAYKTHTETNTIYDPVVSFIEGDKFAIEGDDRGFHSAGLDTNTLHVGDTLRSIEYRKLLLSKDYKVISMKKKE